MDDQDENDAKGVGQNLVPFGQFIKIDTSRRMQGFDNGNSLAYDAYDDRNKTKKFIAIISGVEVLPRWSATAMYDNLNDTSFLRLVGSGVIRWPADGRQKYVFMYQSGAGEPLVDAKGNANMHWRHPEVTALLITPMARMLKEMKEKNFIHGSIRAQNIFYGSADKTKPIVLGDPLAVFPHSTQKSVYLTIDRALAEPYGRGVGSIADDIYAFGVSLVEILRKHNHLAQMSDEEILIRKMESGTYSTLIGSERFQATFLELLRGVLHDDAASRWTVDDIHAWLDGARMNPPAMKARKKANRPITVGGHKHLHRDTLALDMRNNPDEVVKIVENGELGQWIQKSMNNKNLYDEYQRVVERVNSLGSIHENKDYLACQMALVMFPQLPITFKGRTFTYDGLGAMFAQAVMGNENLDYFRQVLVLNIPDFAVATSRVGQNDLMLQVKVFESCRSALRSQKAGMGLEKCLYLLCKSAPCLSAKLKNFFVYGDASALLSYETMCKSGKEHALLLDRHAMAFFSVHIPGAMDKCVHDLNSSDKNRQVAGNLRFFALMQKHAKGKPMPEIANVMLGSLKGLYKRFNNLEMRKRIEEGVTDAAKKGDLAGMSAILDDEMSIRRDNKAFEIAKKQFQILQSEYDQYNRKLSDKKSYGVVNGKDAAAIVAWTISTAITFMTVMAFLSGYKVF